LRKPGDQTDTLLLTPGPSSSAKCIFAGLTPQPQRTGKLMSGPMHRMNQRPQSLKMKVYGKRFGFDISAESERCMHLPKDRDLCPGKISLCEHCKQPEDCLSSGGSTFSLFFQSPLFEDYRTGIGLPIPDDPTNRIFSPLRKPLGE
jgi:hypothetical protein